MEYFILCVGGETIHLLKFEFLRNEIYINIASDGGNDALLWDMCLDGVDVHCADRLHGCLFDHVRHKPSLRNAFLSSQSRQKI